VKSLTNADREFLQAVGIAVELEPDPRLELAHRIAKHRSPAEVPVEPGQLDSAFKQLVVERLLETFRVLSAEEQDEVRRQIYERLTSKPYRPTKQ
jgi:hypothetical protein